MSDILVVKVNMFCRSRELNDIRRYILSQIENGKVVVLPAYCDAQIVPNDIEIIRVEDLSGEQKKIKEEIMKIPQNPFNDALQTCLNNIEEFKKRVEKESELKNSLLSQMANFYTDNFQNTYFKEEKSKRIGQIEYIFCKNGVFFAHVYFLDITTNSKIRKVYSNIELFSSEMEEMTAISEDEYKFGFFDYINKNIKIVENE